MKVTALQLNRLGQDYTATAKEPINIEIIRGALYAFGSELACLRLHLKNPARVGYNDHLESWFYSHDLGADS